MMEDEMGSMHLVADNDPALMAHRPQLKAAPSKWDDAEKWLNMGAMPSRFNSKSKGQPKKSTSGGKGTAASFAALSIGTDKLCLLENVVDMDAPARFTFPVPLRGNGKDEEEEGEEEQGVTALRIEKPTSDYSDDSGTSFDFNRSDGKEGGQGHAICMRDMGTEMTPIASQEPSRTGTPIRATTPNMRSPVASRPQTPGRVAPAPLDDPEQTKGVLLSDKQVQAKTRQEILALGSQLGKGSIVASWSTKEDEDADASKSLHLIDLEEVRKVMIESKASAWEKAEHSKYMARFEREEAKIQAWENHEKAKAEAEMRRIEMKVERLRSHAHEQLMNKLASSTRKAEHLRAYAQAQRSKQAAKTSKKAQQIRRTGRISTSIFFSCLS